MCHAAHVTDPSQLPARYTRVSRLGAGGGGEVWAADDRLSGVRVAVKVLSFNAGKAELDALVREATALSGLEGLGLPRVLSFGRLADARAFLVRELVEGIDLGTALAQVPKRGQPWLNALVAACDQLTIVHRSGLFHGDLKPANMIVRPDGRATLVDLGLAAPWSEGGTRPVGLTPLYAAPELLRGERLTVRAEVYALGVTLLEAIDKCPDHSKSSVDAQLRAIGTRATAANPADRFPSVDELASAIRAAARIPEAEVRAIAWPMASIDEPLAAMVRAVDELPGGGALWVLGPEGSGRTTLVRRLAWTLGAEGRNVAFVELGNALAQTDAVKLQLAAIDLRTRGTLLVLDDADKLDEDSWRLVLDARAKGAALVLCGQAASRTEISDETVIQVPRLDVLAATSLVRTSIPSIGDNVATYIVNKADGRPGALRGLLRRLRRAPLVSIADVDAHLAQHASIPPAADVVSSIDQIEIMLNTGRFDEVDAFLLQQPLRDPLIATIAEARILIGRGRGKEAASLLEGAAQQSENHPWSRRFRAVRARAHYRAANFEAARAYAAEVLAAKDDDADAADMLAISGVIAEFLGATAEAVPLLERAIALAKSLESDRLIAIALGSFAVVQQRRAEIGAAKASYEAALASAERARDAATVAAMLIGLASIAKLQGNLAAAIRYLEGAVDMATRSGSWLALHQALLNLANLELYVGRYERASRSIELLRGRVATMSPSEQAQLLGLEAELSARNEDVVNAVNQFEAAARAWDAQSCPLDALELRIEAILIELASGERSTSGMRERLDQLGRTNGGELGEHRASWLIACAKLARVSGDDERARKALDDALEVAREAQLREWVWQALDARASLFASQGAAALARRDATEALGTLEEVAARLPRDLREVFWNDPRRRTLRESQASTHLPFVATASDRALGVSRHGHTSYAFPPRAEDRLSRLLELTRDLATTHEIDHLLIKITDHAVALLGGEHGMLLLRDERGRITMHTSRSRDGSDAHSTFSRSVAEQVVATGEPVVTVSAANDARLAAAVSVHQLMIQSIACVPIRGAPPGEKTIGALYVETRLREGRLFPQELPILAAFADQAAIAIENARLIAENRERAEALEVANAALEREKAKVAATLERRTGQLVETRRDLRQVRDEIRSHFGYKGIVGTSAPMRRVYAVLERVCGTDVPVLITGESGTGKEVIAKAIHTTSPRAKKPFVGVNCGAIPANLLESELFGHVRGAFTGADRERRGLFREADGGVILLDEIGELPLRMQPALLRVLQEKVVRPIGASSEEPVDVRVIAATNRDLAAMVEEGTFREDLFYRLNVIELVVPPLRDRREDIQLLVDHFLAIFASRYRRDRKVLSRDAIRKITSYEFPGNVRQLEHLLLSAWLLSDNEEIQAVDIELPASRPRSLPPPSLSPDGSVRPISKDDYRAAERERMVRALEDADGNRVQAAIDAGIPRRTFYRRMKEYGLG